MRAIALSARELTVRFGAGGQSRTILDDINIEVRKEEIVCIIGPSDVGRPLFCGPLPGYRLRRLDR